jgi:hypothetical protein
MPQHSPGSYWGRLLRCMVAEIGANKTPAVVMTFDVVNIAHNGEWADLPNPEQRDVKMFLTENAWPHTTKKLQSFGFNGNFENPDFSDTFKAGAELVCVHEQRNGKTYEQWDFPHSGGQEYQKADTNTLRLLQARLRTESAAAPRPAGVPSAPPAPGGAIQRTLHATKTAAAPGAAGPAMRAPAAPSAPGPAAPADLGHGEPPF